MHFVQNMKFTPTNRLAESMREFGLFRFLVCPIKSDKIVKRNKRFISGLHAELENDPWFRDRYEIAVEIGKTMHYITHDQIREYPVWSLRNDSALELESYAEEGHEMIFIRNDVLNIELASRTTPEHMRHRVREMWEIVQKYGDPGLKKCKFIIYGYFQLQPNMCMGMSGSGMSPAMADGFGSIRDPAGKLTGFAGNTPYFAQTLGISQELAESRLVVQLRAQQLMPEYLKNFYENIGRVSDGETYIGRSMKEVDELIGRNYWISTVNKEYVLKRPHANVWATIGDEKLCNSCSVAFSCRYYRRGAVCALPGSEGRSLASLFGSRNSNDVIDGIGKILQFQADRFEKAIQAEDDAAKKAEDEGKPPPLPSPELTKLGTEIQKNAKQYALLINPSLMKPQVNINIKGGQTEIEQPEVTPQIMAQAARELEALGHNRGEITPSMLYAHISRKEPQAIESPVVDGMPRDF